MKATHTVAAVVLACGLVAGCNLLTPDSTTSSTTPSLTGTSSTTTTSGPSVNIDAFAGTWQNTAGVSVTPTGCGNLSYTVTPIGTASANVTFTATCASNISVSGSGSGTLAGSTITWSATGLVGQGGVNCPFSFSNNTATIDSTNTQVTINYTGTVCGIPVSGSQTVTK